MKRKLKLLTLLLISSTLLSGCFPTGEKKPPSSPNSGASQTESGNNGEAGTTAFFPDGVVKYEAENLSIDFTLPEEIPTQLPRIRLRSLSLDTDKVLELVLGDKTIKEAVEQSPGVPNTSMIYYTTDDCRLVISSESFIYIDSATGDNSQCYGELADHFDHFAFESDEELSCFSRQDAVERVNKILDELGIKNYSYPHIIPISYEMANDYYSENPNYTPWTEDEGIYVLKYTFNYNGVEINCDNLRAAGESGSAQGPSITAYVTKNKIFYITTSIIYEITASDEEPAEINFSADEIANEFMILYSNRVFGNPRYYVRMRPEYVPYKRGEQGDTSNMIFTPAWAVEGYMLSGPENNIAKDIGEYYYVDTGIRIGSYN